MSFSSPRAAARSSPARTGSAFWRTARTPDIGSGSSRHNCRRLVTAPVGAPHAFSNPDPDEWATFICTVAPDLYIGYFREVTALQAERGGADEKALLKVMARYATEPYRPPGP